MIEQVPHSLFPSVQEITELLGTCSRLASACEIYQDGMAGSATGETGELSDERRTLLFQIGRGIWEFQSFSEIVASAEDDWEGWRVEASQCVLTIASCIEEIEQSLFGRSLEIIDGVRWWLYPASVRADELLPRNRLLAFTWRKDEIEHLVSEFDPRACDAVAWANARELLAAGVNLDGKQFAEMLVDRVQRDPSCPSQEARWLDKFDLTEKMLALSLLVRQRRSRDELPENLVFGDEGFDWLDIQLDPHDTWPDLGGQDGETVDNLAASIEHVKDWHVPGGKEWEELRDRVAEITALTGLEAASPGSWEEIAKVYDRFQKERGANPEFTFARYCENRGMLGTQFRLVASDQTETIVTEGASTAMPSLEKNEVAILLALKKARTQRLNNYDLEQATKMTRKTIGKKVDRLIELGYTIRPGGKRGGIAITEQGLAAVDSLL